MASVLVALRRLRDDRAPAVGLALLVLVTATIFGIAPRLIDRVGDDALHGTVAAANAFNRNVALIEEQVIPSDTADPLKLVNEEGDRLDRRIPPTVRSVIASRQVVVDSVRFHVEARTPDPSFLRFRIQPGAGERIRFVAGAAPAATRETVDLPKELEHLLPPDETRDPDTPVSVAVLQAAISTEGAAAIVKRVGDLIFLSADSRDPLSSRLPSVAAVRISGIYDIVDPADPFWYDDQSLNHVGVRTLGGDSKLLDVGAFLPTEAYDALIHSGQVFGIPTRITWRHFVDPARLTSGRLDATILDLRRLETTFPTTQVVNATQPGTAMRSGLLPLLVGHANRWASASAILTVVAIGPAAVAIAALALVATIAARRRRPALALVRGRGGTLGQLIRAVFLEGCVIAIPALAVAILVAIAVIPAGSDRPTIIAASAVAVAAVALLIATAMPGTTAAARGTREEDASAPRNASIRRLVFDVLVIVAAAGGAYLLRERGVRGTSSTGTLTGADPLIAAVPALAGIAAGLTAIRLVPIPLRMIGALARRGRGLVPMLALRRAVYGGTTAAVLIVLLSAASIGTFSSAALVHLDRASSAAAWHEIGAPIKVTSQVGSLPDNLDPKRLPGVTASAAMFQTFVLFGSRNLRVLFVAVDLATYESIAGGAPGDPQAPPEMLTPTPAGGVVPVLVSDAFVARSEGVKVGDAFEIVAEGYHYPLRAVAARADFPTLDPDTIFAIASREQLKAVHPEARLSPTTLFLAAPDGQTDAIRTAVTAKATAATVESRAAFAAAFTDSPVTAAIIAGIVVAAIVAALYAALAVAAALALAGASRATEVAHLRMIGLSRRDALGLAIVEHGPTVVLAFIAGVALGFGLFVLLEPGLGIDAIVGSTLQVPLSADPTQLAATFAGILAIAVVGIGLAAFMQRRGSAVLALRRGFEGP